MLVFSILFLIVNLAYWLYFFTGLTGNHKKDEIKVSQPSVGQNVQLVLCIRNEAENLKKYLPKLINQDYPLLNILIINDQSTDDSTLVLHDYARQYPQLSTVTNEIHEGKKKSLQKVIPQIREDILVLTDGDCCPVSDQWVNLLVSPLFHGKEIVLGYGPFFKEKSFLNHFARFECVMTAMQYLSYAQKGIPYMGVGRNLSYRKELFDKVNGFTEHLDRVSGDDDLFINQVASKKNIAIQLDPESFIYSQAPTNWTSFFRQKRRHISSSPGYRWIHKILLAVFAGSHFLFYLSLPWLSPSIVFVLFLIRMLFIYPVSVLVFRKLKETNLLWFLPVLDIMLALYYVVMGIYSIFPNRNKW